MSPTASQITSLVIVYSIVYSGSDQRKHQSSASLAFVRGIHRRPVNSPHKWPVTRKMFPFDDVIMNVSHVDSPLYLTHWRHQAITWTNIDFRLLASIPGHFTGKSWPQMLAKLYDLKSNVSRFFCICQGTTDLITCFTGKKKTKLTLAVFCDSITKRKSFPSIYSPDILPITLVYVHLEAG